MSPFKQREFHFDIVQFTLMASGGKTNETESKQKEIIGAAGSGKCFKPIASAILSTSPRSQARFFIVHFYLCLQFFSRDR